jgi:hypothetical protein
MSYTDGIKRQHGGVSTGFAKIQRMIIGQAHDIKARCCKMLGIPCGCAKQIAGIGIAAGLFGFATI